VYCYAFLHVLKRDTGIKHEKTIKKNKKNKIMCAGGARVPARYAKMPWLEPCKVPVYRERVVKRLRDSAF
jgi:hypothetical protein